MTTMCLLVALLVACNGAAAPTAPPPAPSPPPVEVELAVSPPVRVVFLGDSLTAGLGLAAEEAYPAQLGRAWREAGLAVEVVNAGVSGDTTAGGVRRLDWLLGQKPAVVVVALGANDMLRGIPVEEIEANLRNIVRRSKEAGADVVLVGMRANPTLGPDYGAGFDGIYPRLAAELAVPLVPFLLEGVAGVPALNQPDGLHPTAAGQARLAGLVGPTVEPVVRARAPNPPPGGSP